MAMAMAMSRASASANANVLLAALLCAAAFLPVPSSADESLVSQTCRWTHLPPGLCVSILGSSSHSAAATTVRSLAVAALRIARNSTNVAAARARDLSHRGSAAARPAAVAELAVQCKALYDGCVRATTAAQRLLGTSGLAADVADTFHEFPERCERLFAARRIASPLHQLSRDMQEKLAVAAEIIRLLP